MELPHLGLRPLGSAEERGRLCAGSRPGVEPSSPPTLVQGDEPGATPLSGDDPALRSWDVAFAPTGLVDGDIAQPHPLPAFASPSAASGPGAGVASRPIQAEGVGFGGASRGDADFEANLQQTGDGASIELALGVPAVDIDLGLSAGVGIHLGDLSLSLLGPTDEGSDDPITTAPLAGIAVPVLEGLESLAHSLTGGLLASGGAINVGGAPATDAPDALFVNGRYTDYHLALRVEEPGGSNVHASASGGTVPDLTHLIDAVATGHEAQEPSSDQMVLPAALDDLTLRGSIDHPI